MRKQFYRFSVLFMVLFAVSVHGQTVVVSDNGKARDIEMYTGPTQPVEQPEPFDESDIDDALNAQFPLESHLPMGSFESYRIDDVLPYNVAVVGTDKSSQQWLQKNYKRIQKNNAVVLVIDASSLTEYTRFQNVLRRAGLSVGKVESSMFGAVLKAYPALIVGKEVSQ